MSIQTCVEQLEKARSCVQRARILVVNPTPHALEACQPYLQEAQAALRDLPRDIQEALRGAAPPREAACADPVAAASELAAGASARGAEPSSAALLQALTAFQGELSRLSLLLSKAGEFYLGWMQSLALLTQGYTQHGTVEPLATKPRLLVEG